MSRLKAPLLLVSVGIVAAVAGALLAHSLLRSGAAPVALASGTVLDPPRATQDFTLIDQDGGRFDASRLRDRWTVMFFGFTNCGDICPTTMSLLASVAKSLGDLPVALQPQVTFVSVDAQRDSPEVVKKYVGNFDPKFVGVTGPQTDLDVFTKSLGVPSAIRHLENGGYAVDHSASLLVFNPKGELRALFSPPLTVDALAGDYRLLVGATR